MKLYAPDARLTSPDFCASRGGTAWPGPKTRCLPLIRIFGTRLRSWSGSCRGAVRGDEPVMWTYDAGTGDDPGPARADRGRRFSLRACFLESGLPAIHQLTTCGAAALESPGCKRPVSAVTALGVDGRQGQAVPADPLRHRTGCAGHRQYDARGYAQGISHLRPCFSGRDHFPVWRSGRDCRHLSARGIDLADVANVLEREGIASFLRSWNDLIASAEKQVKHAGAEVMPTGVVKPAAGNNAVATARAAASPQATTK